MYLPWQLFLHVGKPFPDATEGIFGVEDVAKIKIIFHSCKKRTEKLQKKNFEKRPPKVTKMLSRRMNTGLRIVTYVC